MLNCIIGRILRNSIMKSSCYAFQRDAANAPQTYVNMFFVKAATPRPPSTVRAFAYSVNADFLERDLVCYVVEICVKRFLH